MIDAWFAGMDPDDPEPGATRVRTGSVSAPTDWPAEAIDAGFAAGESDYCARLRSATFVAAGKTVVEREYVDDVRFVHTVRAMDDAERIANEPAEQAVERADTLYEEVPHGLNGVHDITVREPKTAAEERVVSCATHAMDLLDERDDPRASIEEYASTTTPNLAEMTRPVLAAWLIALTSGLGPLAKKPSGTIRVLGAEDVLFACLRGRATSPKHGVIFTHEHVRGTHPEDRGSAARALTGKLVIVVHADHYSGNYRPDPHAEPADQIEAIHARVDEGGDE